MEKFITASENSKNALHMMMVSASLPVNILVFGEEGVGRKRLINMAFADTPSFFASELEELLREKKVDFSDNSEIIVYDIDTAGNTPQLIQHLEEHSLQIIATAQTPKEIFDEKFLVKIEISPLSQRPEDTAILIQDYIQKAKDLFRIDVSLEADQIDIDLSHNSLSLKESIYRSLLLNSIKKEQMMETLEQFLQRQIEETSDYKELLEIFEVPLLKAMKKRFKSQLQIASKLGINRNTLRKKMYQYHLEDQ